MDGRFFLACFLLTSSLVAGQSPVYKLKGQMVKLEPGISGPPDSILWKRNGNKVVEFNGQEQDEYGQYKKRISLDWHTADLDIRDLRFEDSGEYELEVYMNKQFSTSFQTLEVMDKVAKPTISCVMNDGGSSNKSGTLVCSAEPRQPQSLMTFEWRSHGKVQPGPNLTISLGDEYDDEVYSCRVRNPLSEETTTFTAKDCYPENDSVLIGVLVTIAILLSLSLLLMGLGIIYCKQHSKACFANDPENLTHPGGTKGSDKNTADEHGGHIDRTPTIPSTQRLHQEQDGDVQNNWPEKGHVWNKKNQFESSFRGQALPITFPAASQRNKDKNKSPPLDRSHLANNNKGDANEDQLRVSAGTEVPQRENPPEPAVPLISSTAAEQSESDKETAEDDENKPLLDTTPTSSSPQPLLHVGDPDAEKEQDGDVQNNWPEKGHVRKKKHQYESISRGQAPPITSPEGSQRNKEKNKRPPLDLNLFANNNIGDANEDQLRVSAGTEVPQRENTPEPAVPLISSTAAEQSGLEENKDEDEETVSPPFTPRSESTSGDAGDADADQLSKPAEEESPHHEKENEPKPADASTNTMPDPEPSTASEHQDLEKDEDEEGKSPPANVVTPVPKPRSQLTQNSPNTDPKVNAGGQKEDTDLDEVSGETDTSGVGETNESGASSEDEQWFTVSEQKDSEKTRHDQDPNLSQSETHTSEDNQQEMDKPVPAAEKESGSEGNSEEPDLSSASSHQPQSSTPTKPDNRSTDTFKETPDAAHEEQVQGGEGKTTKESDESGESEDDTGEDKK